MSRATEDTHYHVGIIVRDVAAAQARLTELLGVVWGPVVHLDGIDVRDAMGNDSGCRTPSATRPPRPTSS